MSRGIVSRLEALLGGRVVSKSAETERDDEAVVAPSDWLEAARLLRDDPEIRCDHFLDLTAIDYPEREPELPRFDVVLRVRSTTSRRRVSLRTRVEDGASLPSVVSVWSGANWAEREVYDMFGVTFADHPDLRRILMYDEFVGHPLRKDYPIDRAQPLVPYRDVEGMTKLAPFGIEEGQPFARVRWDDRLAGGDHQVDPSLAKQQGQRRVLSDSEIAQGQMTDLDAKLAAAARVAAEAAAAAAKAAESATSATPGAGGE